MSDLTFQNNVPDPLLYRKELSSFKFELEKSKGKDLGTVSERKRPSSSWRSPKESPVSRCNLNPA